MTKNTTRIMPVAALAGLLAAGSLLAADGTYDFFALSRYPEGGKLVEGVELYKVKDPGGKPDEYERRVVQWWPRKGVDFVEVREGMPLREWTLVPDLLDEDMTEPDYDWRTFEHDELDMPENVGENYVRMVEGYLHPPADGEYTFKIAADDGGSFFLSTDDSSKNIRLICHSFAYSHRNEFTRRAGQISRPIPLRKGGRYYYYAVHTEGHAVDNLMVVWETATMPQEVIAGKALSTLEGELGKVIEKRASLDKTPLPPLKLRRPSQPRRFRAHLIGFAGIGNDLGDPDKEEDLREPGVMLRMPDGSRQVFGQKSFCREDREYIYRLYQKEMARIKGTLDKTVYSVEPKLIAAYGSEDTPIGQPGGWLKQSDHLVMLSGSQGKDKWVNEDDPEAGARYRALVFSSYENMYAYYEYGGHLMPYWDRKEKYKYHGIVSGTILDGYKTTKGGAGGGYGGQGLCPSPMPGGGFAHEYVHGFNLFNSEITAQHMMCLMEGDRTTGFNNSVSRPWRNNLHASYDTTLFFRALGYDPNWGELVVAAMPQAKEEKNVYQTIARLGQQRGIFKDGIRGVGDVVGDYGARMPELDWPLREAARGYWFAAQRNYLEPVDPEHGVYRIPWDEAPEPFGVNIVRLVPEAGGSAIEVDFQGYHDPVVYSDWRACIVAVDKAGKARYSDLWSKGVMRLDRRPGDRRYWLTVAATPAALVCNQWCYTGRFALRHPWQVTIRGAEPGAPQLTRMDQDDAWGIYGHPWLAAMTPVVPDTERARAFLDKTRAFLSEADKHLATATFTERLAYANNTRFARQILSDPEGAPHPNGGGWVSATAEAAPTAYIGPNVRVLGQARVLDRAIIEDCAVIGGEAVIAGHARVSGQAVITGQTKLSGYQRAWRSLDLNDGDEAPDLTPRLNEEPDENGLWANYAMDQAEAVVLDDYYRSGESRGGMPTFYNGYLYGSPAFLVDDGRRGFAFDGKTQYAELNRHIADLGEITFDMTVKWQGRGEQTLLDCGVGMDNRFTLTTGGHGGGVVFNAVVDGKSVASLTSSEALRRDLWTRVRLEIDGVKIALWVNDKPAGEIRSDFRPADVFRPGRAQRNFIAAAFDGGAKFKGMFENVVVYHAVHGGAFSRLPAPAHDAPRRPERDFVRRVQANMTMSPYEQQSRSARFSDPMQQYLGIMSSKATARLSELMHRSPGWAQAIEKAKAIDAWIEERQERCNRTFDATDESKDLQARIAEVDARIAPLNEKLAALRKHQAEAPEQDVKPTRRMAELRARIEQLDAEAAGINGRIKRIDEEAEAAVAAMPETLAEQREIARLEQQVKPLEARAKAKLEEMLANDKEKDAWDVARRDLAYSPLHWRVRVSQGVGGRDVVLGEQLKERDAEYRRWTVMRDTLEDLKSRRRYRYEAYLMRHGDRADLAYRLGELNQDARAARKELAEASRQAADGPDGGEEADAQRALAALNEKKREIQADLRERKSSFVAAKMREAGQSEKEKERAAALSGARDEAMARYYQEDSAIQSMQRSAFHGFYNAPYKSAIGQYCGKLVGGPRVRDRLDVVQQMAEAYAPENWKTSVDQWDWRTAWEVNGSIDELPLTRKWLQRVRGQ